MHIEETHTLCVCLSSLCNACIHQPSIVCANMKRLERILYAIETAYENHVSVGLLVTVLGQFCTSVGSKIGSIGFQP